MHCVFKNALSILLLMIKIIDVYFSDVDALLKKSESQHDPPEDGCPFGPLTQRLLQALVEVRARFFFNESVTEVWQFDMKMQ